MKKSILFLIILGLFTSCSDDDITNNELLGSWKLIEILISPGGLGTFQPVVSDKIITFSSDGIVTSNGSLCDMSIQSSTPDSGIYSIVDSTINSSGCTLNFELMSSTLIIRYPYCIEPCLAKYIKVTNAN